MSASGTLSIHTTRTAHALHNLHAVACMMVSDELLIPLADESVEFDSGRGRLRNGCHFKGRQQARKLLKSDPHPSCIWEE